MRASREHGFTLIEMIVVIVVMGLALTLVLSHGRAHSPRLTLDAAAATLRDALRVARGDAIGQDRSVDVKIAPDGTITGFGPPTRLRETEILACTPDSDTQATRPTTITFQPDGSARIDGASHDGAICLGAARLHTRISIDWFTGRVRLT